MKRIMFILAVMLVSGACSYSELPPKTDDITTSYVLPKGELPSAEEKAAVAAAKAEYEASIKK